MWGENKVAVITGGCHGIGAAVREAFLRRGDITFTVDARPNDFFSYAMAIDSVSTDPLLALYPVLVMIGGHVIMKERVSLKQHIYLLCIVAGSFMVIVDALM